MATAQEMAAHALEIGGSSTAACIDFLDSLGSGLLCSNRVTGFEFSLSHAISVSPYGQK
jgi:hypothetical protein